MTDLTLNVVGGRLGGESHTIVAEKRSLPASRGQAEADKKGADGVPASRSNLRASAGPALALQTLSLRQH